MKKPLIAFAYKETKVIYYCPMWFDKWVENALPCHQSDRPKTMMYELSHSIADTVDTGYGYDEIQKLTAAENLVNTDTYAFFAKGRAIPTLTIGKAH